MPVLCLLLLPLLAACRPHAVRLEFSPQPGATYSYVVRVEATSDLRLDGQRRQRRTDVVEFDATHTVLDSSEDATRVRVRLRDRAGAVRARTFVVRFDRAGQLTGIDQLESLSADLLGDVGLTELFPAAAAAPPSAPLSPGERWEIEGPVRLPGLIRGEIEGAGRLLELGVEEARDVATVATATRVELERERTASGTRTSLAGTQVNEASITHAIADGSVTRARSVTRGRYDLRIVPVTGTEGLAVTGTLELTIRSVTTRTD